MHELKRNELARDVCQKLTGHRIPPASETSLLLWPSQQLARRANLPVPKNKYEARIFFDSYEKAIERFVQDVRHMRDLKKKHEYMSIGKRNEMCKKVCKKLTGRGIAPDGKSIIQYTAAYFVNEWGFPESFASSKQISRRFLDAHHKYIEAWLRGDLQKPPKPV